MRVRWAEVLLPSAAALLLHVGLLAIYIARNHHDVSVLVGVSSNRVGAAPYEAVTTGMSGYGADGMWYYAIARHPARRQINLDFPANRHLRIGYPFLCWLASGGPFFPTAQARALLWVMPAMNLAAIVALTALGAIVACRYGKSGWWGLLLPLAVNAAIPALRDLTDCFSTLAVLGLMSAWLLGGPWPALAGWALLALFNREQNAAVVGLVLLGLVVSGQRKQAAGVAAAAALWTIWVAALRMIYGEWPFLPSSGNFAAPFTGLCDGLQHLAAAPYPRRMGALLWASLIHAVLVLAAAVWCALRTKRRGLALFLLGGVVLAILGGPCLYLDIYSYRRVLVWHTLGIWLHGMETGERWPVLLLGIATVWSITPALGYV
jgi:hypothetical protein